jgi:hypothetical protein
MFRFSFLILFEETFKKLPLMNKDRKCSLRLLLLHEVRFGVILPFVIISRFKDSFDIPLGIMN